MSRELVIFHDPRTCVIDAEGPFGDRSFFLHLEDEDNQCTVELSKVQVKLLVENMESTMQRVGKKDPDPGATVDCTPAPFPTEAPMFSAGVMGLQWLATSNKAAVEMTSSAAEVGSKVVLFTDTAHGPAAVRFYLSEPQLWQFISRTKMVIAPETEYCPLCSAQLEVSGHLCVRLNSYHGRQAFDPSELEEHY